MLKTARQKFGHLFELHDSVFILDTHVVGSPAMKTLKNYVAYNKDKVTQASVMLFHELLSVCVPMQQFFTVIILFICVSDNCLILA